MSGDIPRKGSGGRNPQSL